MITSALIFAAGIVVGLLIYRNNKAKAEDIEVRAESIADQFKKKK